MLRALQTTTLRLSKRTFTTTKPSNAPGSRKKRHPRPRKVNRIHNNVTMVLTDGRTITVQSPRPVQKIELIEDTVTHSLWRHGIAKQFHTSISSNTSVLLVPRSTTNPRLVSELFQVPVGGYLPFVNGTTTITSSSSASTLSSPSLGIFAQSLIGARNNITTTMSNTYTELLNDFITFIKRTYQPSVLKRKRRHGYRARKSTPGGRKIIKRRMLKGRTQLTQV